jgi:NAD-dependent SIR2 family protein deacetylase
MMESCEKSEVEWDDRVRVKNRASPMLVKVQDCDFDWKEPNRKPRVVFVEEQLEKVELNTARMLLQEH